MSINPFIEIASSIAASKSVVEDLHSKIGSVIEENDATNLVAMLALATHLTTTMERLIEQTKLYSPADLNTTSKIILSFLHAIRESIEIALNEEINEHG